MLDKKECDPSSHYLSLMRRKKPYHAHDTNHKDIRDYAKLNQLVMTENTFKWFINCHHIVYQAAGQTPEVYMSDEVGETNQRKVGNWRH